MNASNAIYLYPIVTSVSTTPSAINVLLWPMPSGHPTWVASSVLSSSETVHSALHRDAPSAWMDLSSALILKAVIVWWATMLTGYAILSKDVSNLLIIPTETSAVYNVNSLLSSSFLSTITASVVKGHWLEMYAHKLKIVLRRWLLWMGQSIVPSAISQQDSTTFHKI